MVDTLGGHRSQVGSGARLGEQLPGALLTAVDLGQKGLLLLLAPPHVDGHATDHSTRVVVRGQGKTDALHLLDQDQGGVEGEAATAVPRRAQGIQPAPFAHPATELPPLQVDLDRFVMLGVVTQMGWGVGLQPEPYLAPELFLLRGVVNREVHLSPSSEPRLPAFDPGLHPFDRIGRLHVGFLTECLVLEGGRPVTLE